MKYLLTWWVILTQTQVGERWEKRMIRTSLNTIIHLTDEQKKEIQDEITAFYLDVRDEEIGVIQKQQIMDLFVENLAPIIYNKALDDTKDWYKKRMEDLECDYYSMYKDNR